MNDSKTWAAITLIIVVVSGFLLFSTFKSKEAEKRMRIESEQKLNSTQQELTQVQADLEQLKKDKAEAEEKAAASIAALQSSVDEYKKNVQIMGDKMASLMKEKESLAKFVDTNTLLVARLNKKIQNLEEEKTQLQTKIKQSELDKPASSSEEETTAKKSDVQTRVPPADIVDLGKIIIHQPSNQAAIVEHVNTLYGFVILSAGSSDGLTKDQIVNITRNNRFIAKAVLKKVRDNVSSAVTLPEWTREDIKVGDLISISDTGAGSVKAAKM